MGRSLIGTRALSALPALALVAVVLLCAASGNEKFTASIVPKGNLDASFHRREKAKNRGWRVFIKFTNKTARPIRSIGTDYQLQEGGWIISSSRTQTASASPLILPGRSAILGWVDGVASSVDSMQINAVEIE